MSAALARLSLWQVAAIAVAWGCFALALPWILVIVAAVIQSLDSDSRIAAIGFGYTRTSMVVLVAAPIAALFAAWWLARR